MSDEEINDPSVKPSRDLKQESLRGGGIVMGVQGVRFLVQMASTMVFARLLTPHDFGYIAMVTTVTGFVALWQDGNLSTVTVQREQISQAQVSALFWINVLLSVAVALVLAAMSPMIAWFFHEPRLVGITIALSVTFVFAGLCGQHQALLRRQMQFKRLAAADLISTLSGFALGIVMARRGFGYWALVGVTFGTVAINCASIWIISGWYPSSPKRAADIRSMLAFGGKLTGFQVLIYLMRNCDNVVIGRTLGSMALGMYSKAYALLALPMNQINTPVSSVVIPALSRLQHSREEYAHFYLRALRLLSFATLPIVVFSAIFAHDLVIVLLGKPWQPVAVLFQLLVPAALVGAINVAPGWLCISLDKSRQQLIYGCVAAPLCLIAFLIGVRWNVEGVAIGFSLTYTVLFWVFVRFATKDSPVTFSDVFSAFLTPLLIAVPVGLTVWLWRLDFLAEVTPAIALGASAVLFAAGYLLLSLLLLQIKGFTQGTLQGVYGGLAGH